MLLRRISPRSVSSNFKEKKTSNCKKSLTLLYWVVKQPKTSTAQIKCPLCNQVYRRCALKLSTCERTLEVVLFQNNKGKTYFIDMCWAVLSWSLNRDILVLAKVYSRVVPSEELSMRENSHHNEVEVKKVDLMKKNWTGLEQPATACCIVQCWKQYTIAYRSNLSFFGRSLDQSSGGGCESQPYSAKIYSVKNCSQHPVLMLKLHSSLCIGSWKCCVRTRVTLDQ